MQALTRANTKDSVQHEMPMKTFQIISYTPTPSSFSKSIAPIGAPSKRRMRRTSRSTRSASRRTRAVMVSNVHYMQLVACRHPALSTSRARSKTSYGQANRSATGRSITKRTRSFAATRCSFLALTPHWSWKVGQADSRARPAAAGGNRTGGKQPL